MFLAVERKTIYRLDIPFVKVGTRRRYRLEDVQDFLTRHEFAGKTRGPSSLPERR